MKRLLFIFSILLVSVIVKAQDFSYLKTIDLKDASQAVEADEAAMECCCYLTGVRYNKKDDQREKATEYIKSWLATSCTQSYLLDELFEEDSDLTDMYLAFYALNYLNHEKGTDAGTIQANALKGLVSYCSNSANKIKLTKELKEIEKMIEAGQLENSIADLDLTSLAK